MRRVERGRAGDSCIGCAGSTRQQLGGRSHTAHQKLYVRTSCKLQQSTAGRAQHNTHAKQYQQAAAMYDQQQQQQHQIVLAKYSSLLFIEPQQPSPLVQLMRVYQQPGVSDVVHQSCLHQQQRMHHQHCHHLQHTHLCIGDNDQTLQVVLDHRVPLQHPPTLRNLAEE